MAFDRNVWDQLRAKPMKRYMKALLRDGWEREKSKSARIPFSKPGHQPIMIHCHPNDAFSPGVLKEFLDKTGWDEDDLRRIGLIK